MKPTESLHADLPTTAAGWIDLLSRVPADARIRINHHKGDRPFDVDWQTITATWETTR